MRAGQRPAIIRGLSNWFLSYGFAEVLGGLVIGAYPLDRDDVGMLERMGIERVLNLVAEEEYKSGEREEVEAAFAAAEIEEYRLSLTDYGGLAPPELEGAVQEVLEWLSDGRRTYVHCRAGWQRSAAVAAGVVALRDEIGIDDALEHVRARKPSADPLPHQREDLHRWWAERHGDDASSPPPAASAPSP